MNDEIKKIPHQFWLVLGATFIIGFIAHGYSYTNLINWHDCAQIYTRHLTVTEGAAAGRWLQPVICNVGGSVKIPFFNGIICLIMYTCAAYFTSLALNLKKNMLMVLIAGIIVTNRTIALSNLLQLGGYVFAIALLLACLGAYFWKLGKWGWGLSWICFYLCASDYAAYMDYGISLFLIQQIGVILFEKGDIGKTVKNHFIMLGVFVSSYMMSYYTDVLLIKSQATYIAQDRFERIGNMSGSMYVERVLEAIKNTIKYFSPNKKLSYFQNIHYYYYIFCIAIFITIILSIYILFKNIKENLFLKISLICVDIMALVLGMGFVDILNVEQDMVHFAYVIPWIFVIYFYQLVIENPVGKNKMIRPMYSGVVLVLCLVTIWEGVKLSNTIYTKAVSLQEAGVHLLNRVVDRIESSDDYIPGETPVILVGNLKSYYGRYNKGYELTDGLELIGLYTGADYAFTYDYVIYTYIAQQLNVSMNIIDIKFGNSRAIITNSYDYADEIYSKTGYTIDPKALEQLIDSDDGFPSERCAKWCGEVLVLSM